MPDSDLKEAAHAIVSCRDFCGDERETLRDWEGENRKLSQVERNEVRRIAEQLWRASQIEAGVVAPIDQDERRAIYRILERAE